jgi:hypothetical protein
MIHCYRSLHTHDKLRVMERESMQTNAHEDSRMCQSLPTRQNTRSFAIIAAGRVVFTSYRYAKEMEMTSGIFLLSLAFFVGH